MDKVQYKKIDEIFDVRNGDVISIVGSGGKTTLMFQLAKELKKLYKVLVTTSTKIYKPLDDNYDYLYTSLEEYCDSLLSIGKNKKDNSITVISNGIYSDENKLVGINDRELESIIKDFDVVLIEADGSRGLPLKGWKEHEPPILLKTNKTIGIIPIDIINRKINENFIYGYEEFKNIVGDIIYIDFEVVGKLCSDKLGLFKNSRGSLYLFINRADNENCIMDSINLVEYLSENIVGNPYNFKICYGSLKAEKYYED